jgi:hypothetical protein
MSDGPDLVGWLLTQIAQDEASFTVSDSDWALGTVSGDIDITLRERLLSECIAKRELVEIVVRMSDQRWATHGVIEDARTALKLLALPYADRDGYLDEWRPS